MLAADALMASAVAWDKLLPEATSPADVELVDFPLLLDDTDASSSDVDSALDAVLLPWDEAEEIDMEPAESEPWSPPAVKELPHRKGRRRNRVGKSKSKKLSAEAAPIRVRTYTARKNEIEQLNAELPQLEAYVDLLKQQAARTAGKQSSVDKLRLANSKLRDLAHRQQYPLIRVQSAMSRLVTDQQQMVPLDRSIYLSKDSAARSATLMAVQPRVLRDARFFMKERTWHLDTRVLPVREQQSFTSPDGSFCATDFSATRLEGVSSVKRAYDTLRAALSKRDSLFSELSGDCTVCEELDPLSELAERGITHSRIVRSAPGGLLVESNTAEFAEYRPREDVSSDGHDHGLIVFHAIESDQLHPYLTDQQLRFDVKTVFSVETRMCPSRDPSETPESREDVEEVVISRSSFLKLHRTSLAVSLTEMALTRDRLVQQGNLLVDSVLSILAQQE